MTPDQYIDQEFETVLSMGIKGKQHLTAGERAVYKMMFIAGMASALGYPGTDELGPALKRGTRAISEQYGGRTIFPVR